MGVRKLAQFHNEEKKAGPMAEIAFSCDYQENRLKIHPILYLCRYLFQELCCAGFEQAGGRHRAVKRTRSNGAFLYDCSEAAAVLAAGSAVEMPFSLLLLLDVGKATWNFI